jgi:hypothetical protein
MNTPTDRIGIAGTGMRLIRGLQVVVAYNSPNGRRQSKPMTPAAARKLYTAKAAAGLNPSAHPVK